MEDKKARKSVSFLDTAEAVNGNGSVVEATNNFDGAKSASEDQPAGKWWDTSGEAFRGEGLGYTMLCTTRRLIHLSLSKLSRVHG
jgi:hypothetical protein